MSIPTSPSAPGTGTPVVASLPPKQRSPNYPAINLEDAIARIRKIYEKQRRYPTTREVLVTLMGYKSLNGASATVVSALSKYGLLEGQGDQLRISDLGETLALHRKGDPEYADALRTAALLPTFFRELHDQYPAGLPSEHHLRVALTRRGFTSKAIDSAVRAYRDTIEFVEAETGGAIREAIDSPVDDVLMQTPPIQNDAGEGFPPSPGNPQQRAVALPLLGRSEWASLQAPFPLTEAAWDHMLEVLAMMKPALIVPPDPQQPPQATATAGTAPFKESNDGAEGL